MTRAVAVLRSVLAFLVGFVQEHTNSSSARLAGLALTFTGCAVALAGCLFAFRHPDHVASLTAFAAIVTALLGSGFGVLWSRSRTGVDAPTPGGPA